jgi:tripartite-type tricarboxylate transporter receptor subunit TctC
MLPVNSEQKETLMFITRRKSLQITANVLAMPFVSRTGWAQNWPARPITIVDTFPPGGSTGIIARILADKFSETMGQQFIVDQRGGAAGTVGARQIARSAPDGYTLMLGFTGTLAIAPSMYAAPGYDPRKDFAPIGRIGTAPSSLVVHPSFPGKNVAELIEYAKKNPGKVNFGSAGVGSVNHVAGELFANMASIKLSHVPYRGTGPALTDLLGGHIPAVFAPVPATYENAKNGQIRMLGVTSLTRSSLIPEMPTIAEQGLAGYEAVLRYGLVAPTGTPRPIIDRLNKELREMLASDVMRARFATVGAEPLSSTPEEYANDIEQDHTKWSTLVKSLGLKAE